MTPVSSDTDRIRDIYDRLAPDWDAREGASERVPIGSRLRKELASALQGEVLELGCGTGATFQHLDWSRIASYSATDISPGMLDQAGRRPEIAGRPVTFRQIDATSLPFPDASFDTVTTSLTLCTVPDPERTLREMSRVCRPTGRIVLLEHVRAPNRLLAWLQAKLTPAQTRRMGCHFDRPTDETIRRMGFPIERHERRLFSIFRLMVLRPLPLGTDDSGTKVNP